LKQYTINIITGLSGSGKSTALAAFADSGFYCVDNMPVALLPKFLELPLENDPDISGFAFVMDLREKDFIESYPSVFKTLEENDYRLEIIFLEADEDVLVRRYSQTRRHHPLSYDKGLLSGISKEFAELKPLKNIASKIIDTSKYNVHDLKAVIIKFAQQSIKTTLMRINIVSFGFKYGVPNDSDLIIDVRFLNNPFFIHKLKQLTGKSKAVKDFVLNNDKAKIFLEKYLDLLDFLIPLYEKEGKAYLSIAIGCTGGHHRSVAVALKIYEHISIPGRHTTISHRDIDR
jgi:RNase adapter protein RapZ